MYEDIQCLKEQLDFIKGAGANIYKDCNGEWNVVTLVSECRHRDFDSALYEAMEDHLDAIRDGDVEAEWRIDYDK